MTRPSDEQLELDFESAPKLSERPLTAPEVRLPASIFYFSEHQRSRRDREEKAIEAKLLEQIASRVQHFK